MTAPGKNGATERTSPLSDQEHRPNDSIPGKAEKKSAVRSLIILLLVVAALVVLAIVFDLPKLISGLLDQIRSLGAWGPVIYIGIYILATVAFVPGSLLTLAAGLLFGVVYGSVYVSIASTIGACLAFLCGRFLFRGWVQGLVAKRPRFAAIDRAVEEEGWKIVLLTRLSPVFPFNALNYAYGLTGLRFLPYALASWIGMIPATIMYVYIGSLAGDLSQLASGASESPDWLRWVLNGIGFTATVIVTVFVTRMARKALKRHVEEV